MDTFEHALNGAVNNMHDERCGAEAPNVHASVLRGLYSHSPSGSIPVWMPPDRCPLSTRSISSANSRKYKYKGLTSGAMKWRMRTLGYGTGSLSLVQRLRGLCCVALGPPKIWARPLARANERAYGTGSLSLVQRLRGPMI
mgnify:CR=1 FL=1